MAEKSVVYSGWNGDFGDGIAGSEYTGPVRAKAIGALQLRANSLKKIFSLDSTA